MGYKGMGRGDSVDTDDCEDDLGWEDKFSLDEETLVPMENSQGLDRTIGENRELEEKIDDLMERRDGVWVCMQCGKSDKIRFPLRRHVETHLAGYSHSCLKCTKTFATRGSLQVHIYRIHHEEKSKVVKTFPCDICDKMSVSTAAVKIHKMRNH